MIAMSHTTSTHRAELPQTESSFVLELQREGEYLHAEKMRGACREARTSLQNLGLPLQWAVDQDNRWKLSSTGTFNSTLHREALDLYCRLTTDPGQQSAAQAFLNECLDAEKRKGMSD